MRNIRIADPRDRSFDQPPTERSHSRLRDLIATLPIIFLVPALVLLLFPALARAPMQTPTPSWDDVGSATLTAAPPSGRAGTKIVLRGAGFDPGQRGNLLLDDAMTVVGYRASGNGRFNTTVVIPKMARPGVHRLRAVHASVVKAEVKITVLASSSSPLPPADPTPAPPDSSAAPTVAPTVASGPTVAPTPRPTVAPTPHQTVAPTLRPAVAPTPAPVAAWMEDFASGMGAFAGFDHIYSPTSRVDPAQSVVSDGILNITARAEGGGKYVSGMALTSRTFDHGYFEARIKFSAGTAISPAFWLRRPVSVPRPRSEIDILEAYPNNPYQWPGPNRYQATMHYVTGSGLANHQITHDAGVPLTDTWHIYAAHWLPGQRLAFYLDGVSIGSINADVLAPTAMNIVLSLGVGTWSADPDATTPSTTTMQVDWVRWRDTKP